MTLKNGFGKCLSAKENPTMEKALFDWSILLQYDVKVKYRLILIKESSLGKKFFQPSVRLTSQKPRTFVRAFSFQVQTKIALTLTLLQVASGKPASKYKNRSLINNP